MIKRVTVVLLSLIGLLALPQVVSAQGLPGEIIITTDTLLLGIRLGNWFAIMFFSCFLGGIAVVIGSVLFAILTDQWPWQYWSEHQVRRIEDRILWESWYNHCLALRNRVVSLDPTFVAELHQIDEQIKFGVLVQSRLQLAKLHESYQRLARRALALNREIDGIKAGVSGVSKKDSWQELKVTSERLDGILKRYISIEEDIHAVFLKLIELNEDIERANAQRESEQPRLVDALPPTQIMEQATQETRTS